MLADSKMAKHIADASWGTFLQLLRYKADWNNKEVVAVDRYYPSSKTCYSCGWVNGALDLSTRKWTCANGHVVDRDENAALNILAEVLNNIGAGLLDYRNGGSIRRRASDAFPVEVLKHTDQLDYASKAKL